MYSYMNKFEDGKLSLTKLRNQSKAETRNQISRHPTLHVLPKFCLLLEPKDGHLQFNHNLDPDQIITNNQSHLFRNGSQGTCSQWWIHHEDNEA